MASNATLFLDPGSDDVAVLRAISRMDAGETSSNLLTRVANDPAYRPFHRAVAIRELFKRHVTKPMPLTDVARLLEGGRWLLDAEIERIELMGGEIPIRIPAGGAAFIIRLPHGAEETSPRIGLYLALDHMLDADLLRDALMAKIADPSVGRISIVDFALFPENLDTAAASD